jgi:hypothetical protein
VFKILGVKEVFKPPIKPPISENLTVLGYPDYTPHGTIVSWGGCIKIRILPPQERTLGGAVSRFADAIVAVLTRSGILSVAEPTIDAVSAYPNSVPQSPPELSNFCSMKVQWIKVLKLLSNYNELEQDGARAIQGLELRCADAIYPSKEESIRNSTNILNFFRTTMPAIIT